MKSAMFLNGEARFTLAAIRALSKKGIKIIVGGNRTYSRSFCSKYICKHFYYNHMRYGMEKAHNTILKYVKEYKPSVFFPMALDTYYLILKYKEEYEKYTSLIPMLGHKNFCQLDNKSFQMKLAKEHKIPTPKTYFPRNINDVERFAKKISYPVLLKPLVSATGDNIRYISNPNRLVEEYKHFEPKIDRLFYKDNTFLIQEYIPLNTEYAYSYFPKKDYFVFQHNRQHVTVYVLFNHGDPIALYANTYENPSCQMPFSNHYTTISIKNEELMEKTVKLFKKIKFHGCASIQYILDQRDDSFKLIEINPRVWGSLESAIKAGIDFPYLMYQLALDKKVELQQDYQEGLRFKWIIYGELYRLWKSKNKVKALTDLFKSNTHWEVSLKDPLPHIVQFTNRSFL